MSIGREALLRLFLPWSITALPMVIRAATAALVLLALLVPAHAQFWGDSWGGRQQPQQRQQPYNPFGGFWGDRPGGFWGERPFRCRTPRGPPKRGLPRKARSKAHWLLQAERPTVSAIAAPCSPIGLSCPVVESRAV